MSTLHADSSPVSAGPYSPGDRLAPAPTSSIGLMQQDVEQREIVRPVALDAHDHARAIIRLIQCPACCKPYNYPITFPCGRSLCRACLPPFYERERVTWPDLPDRRQAIRCPFESCREEHTLSDCSVDVALSKVMESIAEVIANHNAPSGISGEGQDGDDGHGNDDDGAFDLEKASGSSVGNTASRSQQQPVGRLIAAYTAAAAGNLPLNSLPDYNLEADPLVARQKDAAVLADLLDACQRQLDCQVCYNLMLDPITTSCGHTLCRQCLVRTLDHSMHCPVCRRVILSQPSLQSHQSNHTLSDLLQGLCPELIKARKEALASEEASLMANFDTPLFVVTLGFPGCPTFLRIFEPRYRLMLRRALEGNRTFGIVMYNARGAIQGELGQSHFMQYGTLLRIDSAEMLSNGTSIIEARGVARFKILSHGVLDGYSVGRVERVEDIPLAQEETIELSETAAAPPAAEGDVEGQLKRMSTQELLDLNLSFVNRMQARSTPWLNDGILHAYGLPPNDATNFPYWFASILPVAEEIKYQLLHTTSVRERLKITARWVKLMEQQRWYVQEES